MHYNYKKTKKKVWELLNKDDFEKVAEKISRVHIRKVIGPLIFFLYSSDKTIKQRAITVIGIVVSRLADHDIKSACAIMRRIMWGVNDKSGSISWVAPEVIPEIMARNKKLANEYHKILISYTIPNTNDLEHEDLQKSVHQSMKKFALKKPELVKQM